MMMYAMIHLVAQLQTQLVLHVVAQTGEFAQGYDNAMGLVVAVFLAVSFFMLIGWLTKRRH
jgi:hypothetical protein